jgi:gamma-glutamyltranspeptidase/glutathione hydrolase
VAPRTATRDLFAADDPKQSPSRSMVGGLAVAVPAEGAGLAALHDKLGKLPLAQLVEPAARLAREGFVPSPRLVDASARFEKLLPTGEPMRAWLLPDGKPLTHTSKVKRPTLAATLLRFGKEGRKGIYRGPIAEELVASVKAHGGALTLADLEAYQPLWRDPLVGRFRDRQLYAAPPPAGGATAIEALQFLDALPPLPKGSLGSSAWYHRVTEALTHAFADRIRFLGDPAFVKVPIEKLTSLDYSRALAAKFHEDAVLPIEQYGTPISGGTAAEPPHDHGTSHVCVVDGEGNAVAITTTINLPFGAQFEAGRSGIVLNDQMDDFTTHPGQPNALGLVGSEANAIAPGKRPTSSMTPLLVVDEHGVLACAGGSGGPTIVASSVQVVAAILDEDVDAQTAVNAPRIYAQWKPEAVIVEADIATDVIEAFQKRGHKTQPVPRIPLAPAAQVIVRRGDLLEAASDPRKGGAPAAP